MQSAVLGLAIGILAIIAYGDVRRRQIPNTLSLAIAALGLVRMALAHDPVAAGYTLAAGAVIFAVGFLLFCRGAIGGGDAKLVPALALLIGYQQLPGFLFLMSVFGGALAVVIVAAEPLRRRAGGLLQAAKPAPGERPTVPYGLAIAAAGAITLTVAR